MSRSPSQKRAMDDPRTANTLAALSTQPSGRAAAAIPIGTPISVAIRTA